MAVVAWNPIEQLQQTKNGARQATSIPRCNGILHLDPKEEISASPVQFPNHLEVLFNKIT